MSNTSKTIIFILLTLILSACQLGGMLGGLTGTEEPTQMIKPTLKTELIPTATVVVIDESTTQEEISGPVPSIPYYFIAVHNEPYNYPSPRMEKSLAEAYTVLSEMVAYADRYNIKLTLMLSPSWVDYILSDGQRQAQVIGWKANGHELAAHHHSIYHGNWDGYTDQPFEFAVEQRQLQGKQSPEQYYGSMNDLMDVLHRLDPQIRSGCLNDEQDKADLPDGILYDTCSGFANNGNPGTILPSTDPMKGLNEYILTGQVNGVQHKWLSHAAAGSLQAVEGIEALFRTLNPSLVYGTIFHSFEDQAQAFYAYADFLHGLDPEGANSLTLTQAIEDGILTEAELDAVTLEETSIDRSKPAAPASDLCGDGVCDQLEQKNAALCPVDCGR